MARKYLASTVAAAALSFGAAHAASAAGTTTTLNTGGSSIAGPTYIAMMQAYTASKPTILFDYEAVGAGAGQKAFLNNDITQFEYPPAGVMATGTLTYGTVVGTQVDFGASDAPLSASQLTNPATGSYTNSGVDGPLIQIPTFGVPIALAYNETAETSTLSLTDAQLCGVLSGKITDWHTLNSKIAAGTTIQVVYFSNSSGATYLTSQHLNAVCTSSNSNFPEYPVPITKYFYSTTAANNPIFLSSPPPNFTGEAAAANAAAEMVATPNSFGYISPDWTSIAPKSANTTALKVASVVNGINNKGYTPTVANTETGLANAGPGSQYPTPPNTLTNAMDPINWVPTIPQTSKGYSIVGYSTVELSSCYASTTAGTALNTFLTDLYQTSSYKTIITNNGFVPLSNTAASPYITSVLNDFLSNKSGYNLNIDSKSLCASYPGR